MGLESHNDNLLEELISHKELLAGSRDVSITVLKSHTSKSSLLNLDSDVSGKVEGDLSLLRWMDSWVSSGGPDVESFIAKLVYHDYFWRLFNNYKLFFIV